MVMVHCTGVNYDFYFETIHMYKLVILFAKNETVTMHLKVIYHRERYKLVCTQPNCFFFIYRVELLFSVRECIQDYILFFIWKRLRAERDYEVV